MPLVPLKLPPGMYRNGTKYQTKGRWFTGTLIRWYEGVLQAIGGWQNLTDSSDSDVQVDQPPRDMYAWRSDSGIAQLAIGSYCKAWAFVTGTLTEITPDETDFACGTEDATVTDGGAYGEGDYSAGPYGGVVSDANYEIIEAGTWTFDNFGEDLVACPFPDGRIFDWDLNPANILEPVSNAPTANSIVVTPEEILVALGANGDRRLVAWSDQEDRTTWTATDTNQAGDFPLSGEGELMFGRRGRKETLLWTDTSLWAMRYVGLPLVYNFTQVGDACGAISRHCGVVIESKAYWMGKRSFFVYDGFVNDLPCDVADYVFDDINWTQISKVHAIPISEWGEVIWFYPSAESTENDRYVKYNYRLDTWDFGDLNRTAGVDRGAHRYPIWADSDGNVYQHELGDTYLDENGSALTPFAESGPVEIGNGDRVATITYLIPDDKTLGDVNATLYMSFHPDASETSFGPFDLTVQEAVRKTGRWIRLRVDQVNPNWRVGVPRMDIELGGRR